MWNMLCYHRPALRLALPRVRRLPLSRLPNQDLVLIPGRSGPLPIMRPGLYLQAPPAHRRVRRHNRNFVDYEAFDKIRRQPEVMNNLIAFTASEAIVFLQHVYTLHADQLLDSAELGAIPSYRPFQLANTLDEDLLNNPFYCALAAEISEAPKAMTTPTKLENIMSGVLNSAVVQYTMLKHSNQLFEAGVDMDDDVAVLKHSLQNFEDVNSIKDNWVGIVKMWVDLLAWRHIERTAPAEDGTAERLRQPLAL
jgi:hypothetical protein